MGGFTYGLAALTVGLVLLLVAQLATRKPDSRKMWTGVSVVLLVIASIGYISPGTLPFLQNPIGNVGVNANVGGNGVGGGVSGGLAVAGSGGSNGNDAVVSTYQPTATYSAQDMFASTTAITGTQYYKKGGTVTADGSVVGGERASTSALSNVNVGDTITYWVDNSSLGFYYVNPLTKKISSQTTPFTATGYKNGTVTITGYDLVNRQSTGASVYNTSMGANKQATIEITYAGTSKQSAAPFGGAMIVEYNSTIPTVTCSGGDLLSSNKFHVTYSTFDTAHTYKQFDFAPSLDDGVNSVAGRKIVCQFINGGTSSGGTYNVTFIPANYYVSQSGDLLLDTQKDADGSVTRTVTSTTLAPPKLGAYWGA